MNSPDGQRMQRAAWVDYPPVTEGGPVRRRLLVCVQPCRDYATTGCVQSGHLVGEAEDVLPPVKLTLSSKLGESLD